MGNPIEAPSLAHGGHNSDKQPKFDPFTGKPLHGQDEQPEEGENFWSQQAQARQAEHVRDTIPPPSQPVNPYAPTGWQAKRREQFDVTLPSGQLARITRLEREDLFRMNLMGYLDTFAPMLMEETISAEERAKRVREKMNKDPNAIANMFMAIDEVVMASTVKPRVTDKEELVDYGGPNDWSNPRFIATAYINDIEMDDRFAIFAAAFGRSMDDLKSVLEQEASVASVADQPSVQQTPE